MSENRRLKGGFLTHSVYAVALKKIVEFGYAVCDGFETVAKQLSMIAIYEMNSCKIRTILNRYRVLRAGS